MRTRLLLSTLTLLLSGCASIWQDHGNVTETALSPVQQRTVANVMADAVFHHYGSRSVFSFPHRQTNTFAVQLAGALRARGIGVNESDDSQGYYTPLHYKVVNLNPQQFYTELDIRGLRINQIWSLQDNILAPVATQTEGTLNGEG
ncbi:hypothetical protein [Citrobacter koseri]|uniref:hypothetical protein n=1 Tax=Citrobacter koseri TaxID=545 RepID=UPI001F366866|nr:hypothetical protein [Citrobacter koseri]